MFQFLVTSCLNKIKKGTYVPLIIFYSMMLQKKGTNSNLQKPQNKDSLTSILVSITVSILWTDCNLIFNSLKIILYYDSFSYPYLICRDEVYKSFR